MTRRRDLEQRKRSLEEIRKIMNSMKTLAYMETRKLAQRVQNQSLAIEYIERAAADFFSFHPYTFPLEGIQPVYLLIGTERGFCGDFNEQVLRFIQSRIAQAADPPPILIVVGRRLCARFAADPRLAGAIEGADVTEEADRVLGRIIDAMTDLRERYGPLSLTAVFHRHAPAGLVEKSLLPPFQEYAGAEPLFPFPPLLNLQPSDFLFGLIDNYLIAVLHEILYASLMTENLRRVQQLEGAVRHLDERTEALGRKSKQLRQEEIIEEIEVILLGATGLQPYSGGN
jgi:F-type H+-transporting ATPase subunit gamma